MTPEDQIKAHEALMAEMSGAMADMVTAIEQGRAPLEEISATLVDMLAKLESKSPITEIAEAIRSIRIEGPTVNVSPTPITVTPVVQILERVQPGSYDLKVQYDNHDRITSARLTPVIDRSLLT